jgi:hypothetical protein
MCILSKNNITIYFYVKQAKKKYFLFPTKFEMWPNTKCARKLQLAISSPTCEVANRFKEVLT